MSIVPIPPISAPLPIARTPEGLENKKPDHDSDAEDKGAGVSPASSAPPPGMGHVVDGKA